MVTNTAIAASLSALQQELLMLKESVTNTVKKRARGDRNTSLTSQITMNRSDNNCTVRDRSAKRLNQTPIAIIGMSALFPKAKDISSYWNNIIKEVDCLTEVPESRWNTEDYYDADPFAADKTYCKRGGFIPDVDFNPMEFGLPPNILEATDISQLLSLVVAREAIKDAGYSPHAAQGKSGRKRTNARTFDRGRTGVVLGTVGRQMSGPLWARLQYPVWEKVLENSGLSQAERKSVIEKMKLAYVGWQENSFPGMLSNVTAGRIANRFDFGGLNCTLDAACASSLAALKMAISELTEHRADMMLTGGVDPDNSAFAYLCFSKTPALSRQQHSKPFDADSDGMMLGEGAGMVVLKRLADAERDGDRIYATIRGIGTSSDGRYKSIYAPRPAGQLEALKRAYQDAETTPNTVGLIEAHGTGTTAGDIAEFTSLKLLFKQIEEGNKVKQNSIAIGSVKSQIGHTKTAAGIAGLIKASLALHHKVLPPTINVSEPNPKLEIENSPFYLNASAKPWISTGDQPRKAGVSSFGFGGTNFHVVMQEYKKEQQKHYRVNLVPQPVLLFASNPSQLVEKCEKVLAQIQQEDSSAYESLLDASRTLHIPTAAARLGFIVDDRADAINKLNVAISTLKASANAANRAQWEHPKGVFYRHQGADLSGKVVALFSGQGAQYLGMGQALAVNFPELRRAYAQMDGAMTEPDATPVSQVVYPQSAFTQQERDRQSAQLKRTEYAQPAIGAFSMGLYTLFSQAGLSPSFACGHSFGELTALWAAGVLSEVDYCKLVRSRGKAMATASEQDDPGTMLAVQGDVEQVETLISTIPEVEISNFNSSQQVVLSGAKAAIEEAANVVEKAGLSALPLSVSAAFHTDRMRCAREPFDQAIESTAFRPQNIPTYSNATGEAYPNRASEQRSVLKQHIVSPVKFRQQIENIYAAGGRCFVEFGPRRVLTNFVEEILGDRPHVAIPLNASRRKDSDRQLREAAVRLRVEGLSLGEIDPYRLQKPLAEGSTAKKEEKKERSQLVVQLNGSSYVSEKTKQAFETALAVKAPVKAVSVTAVPIEANSGSTQTSTPPLSANHTSTVRASTAQPAKVQDSSVLSSTMKANSSLNGRPPANGFSRSSITFSPPSSKANAQEQSKPDSHKNGAASSQGLPSRNGKGAAFFQDESLSADDGLSAHESVGRPAKKEEVAPVQKQSSSSHQILQSLDRTLSLFNQHQSQVADIHEQYLENHQDYTKAVHQLTLQRQSLIFPASDKVVPSETVASSERSLMSFHAHQGETLRVHDRYLSGQMTCAKQFFELGQQTYRSLLGEERQADVKGDNAYLTPPETTKQKSQTVGPLQTQTPLEITANEEDTTQTAITEKKPTLENSISVAQLRDSLLAVVSDKTGYPVEMLEMDMDMEADLGIDSLKRVEIVGAFQEKFPSLPQPSVEELAERELRSLEQIVNYMGSLVAGKEEKERLNIDREPASAQDFSERATSASAPQIESPNVENVSNFEADRPKTVDSKAVDSKTVNTETNNIETISLKTVQQQLLAVVSDKTGYPAEMLEMDMDMEADLGIDSLKRVEIVGAFQEKFPGLAQPSIEELAERELKTLAQVAEYMSSLATREEPPHKVPDSSHPAERLSEDTSAQKKSVKAVVTVA